jgi:hypothetical protein
VSFAIVAIVILEELINMKKKEKILKQYEIHADKIYNKTLDTLDVVKEIEELYNELNNTFTKKEII